MSRKQGSYELWVKMGSEIQDIENRLIAFLLNPNYSELFTARLIDTLLKATRSIETFKSGAEDRMIHQMNPPQTENHKYLGVFYGENFAEVVDLVASNYDPGLKT